MVAAAKAVADGVRANVLRVLKDESYGVMELCRILDTPQPALSHHLKVLHQAGLVVRRREGNTLFYRRAPAPGAMHTALLAAIDQVAVPEAQMQRIDAVHQARSERSEDFFAAHADDFASNQARISEVSVYAGSVMDIIDRHRLGNGTALEIGPGDGELLAPLAERFDEVVGIDSSRSMLERSAERAGGLDNVRLRHRDFADLPPRPRYQVVVAAMVVHHVPSPQRFFRQAQRLLRRGGALVVVELCRHDQEWARDACGDLWLGFEPGELAEWAENAGFTAGESQFLAQKNGFRIQIHTYQNNQR
ncbi:MAG: metalloregulator ArsR/SmtB family transcription factor [Gammaproteobacteria bacterium]|nr:metalloregulator ArsR/SmtB family transcription factor [Gammaproteobacteria bacterium]